MKTQKPKVRTVASIIARLGKQSAHTQIFETSLSEIERTIIVGNTFPIGAKISVKCGGESKTFEAKVTGSLQLVLDAIDTKVKAIAGEPCGWTRKGEKAAKAPKAEKKAAAAKK